MLPYKESRENKIIVCPLQLDIIERLLTLYSNPDDIILEPYMGVGSTVCAALQYGRKAIGIELKSTYYRQSKENIQDTLKKPWYGDTHDLFSQNSDNGNDEIDQQRSDESSFENAMDF
jgi:DNA modification methylase